MLPGLTCAIAPMVYCTTRFVFNKYKQSSSTNYTEFTKGCRGLGPGAQGGIGSYTPWQRRHQNLRGSHEGSGWLNWKLVWRRWLLERPRLPEPISFWGNRYWDSTAASTASSGGKRDQTDDAWMGEIVKSYRHLPRSSGGVLSVDIVYWSSGPSENLTSS